MDDSYSTPIISLSIIERNSPDMEKKREEKEKGRHGIASNTRGRSQCHNFLKRESLSQRQVDVFSYLTSRETQS